VLYKKGLQDMVKSVGPMSIGGGLKSPEFLKLNPQVTLLQHGAPRCERGQHIILITENS
jgi:hypothetical protein